MIVGMLMGTTGFLDGKMLHSAVPKFVAGSTLVGVGLGEKGSWLLSKTVQGSERAAANRSKSSSNALSVCELLLLLVRVAEGLDVPSLPKLSMLTASLFDLVVKVGEPGGLRSIKQTAVSAALFPPAVVEKFDRG